jgi:hypothetical protein
MATLYPHSRTQHKYGFPLNKKADSERCIKSMNVLSKAYEPEDKNRELARVDKMTG